MTLLMNSIDLFSIVVNIVSIFTTTQLLVSILIIWLSYKTYKFWTCDGSYIYGQNQHVFKDVEDAPKNGAEIFPNTWYPTIRSQDVLPGQLKPLYVFEKNLVVFRNRSGKVHVLDAFCPHLGANIGVGGSVVGDDIRCPFHGWTFNGDGICTSVPGLEAPNIPKAKLKLWDCVERNRWVYIWYHNQNTKPTWMPKEHQELKNSQYCGHFTGFLGTHFINWYLNPFDENHFYFAHQIWTNISGYKNILGEKGFHLLSKLFHFEYKFEGQEINCQKTSEAPYCKIVVHMIAVLFGFRLERLQTTCVLSTYTPNFLLEITIPYIGAKYYAFMANKPIAQRKWIMEFQVYNAGHTFVSKIVSKVAVNYQFSLAFTDFFILNNMKTLKKPCYAKHEKNLPKFNRWVIDNFFSPKHETLQK